MRCLKCGAAIPEGKMYCPRCGSPVRIVPDYSSLEDLLADEVNEVMRDDYDSAPVQQNTRNTSYDTNTQAMERERRARHEERIRRAEEEERKKNKRASRRKLAVLLVLVCAALAVMVYFVLQNSYSFQINKADRCYAEQNYAEALQYYTKASGLRPASGQAKTGMGKCYIAENDLDSAEKILTEAVKAEPSYADSYLTLASLYESQGNTGKIKLLFDDCKDDTVRSQCAEYIAETPSVTPAEGSYTDAVTVTMTVSSGTIYYTTDGSEPSASNGEQYTKAFQITDSGNYSIRAISVNAKGIESDEASETLKIDIPTPEGPSVSPQSGSYSTSTKITVTVPSGMKVYYTLDGSDPTTSSKLYTGPISMPEGSTTFSCISVNSLGKTSSVIKRQYKLIIID